MPSSVVTMSGYAGAALSAAMVAPQLVRTLRDRGTAGVSPFTWALTAVGCLTWILYGVKEPALPQIPGNVLLVPGAAVIAVLAPAGLTAARRTLLLAGAGAAVTLAALAGLPAECLGYLAFAISAVSTLPQAITSALRLAPAGTTAVSVPAWGIRAVAQVCWLGYAIPHRDLPIGITSVVNLACAIIVVAAERGRSERGRSERVRLERVRLERVQLERGRSAGRSGGAADNQPRRDDHLAPRKVFSLQPSDGALDGDLG